MTVRETVEFPIRETTFGLKHSRIGINPLVSEYSRDITFLSHSTIGRKTPLMIDGCGGYPINCYLLKKAGRTFVRLEDSVSEHLLDLDFQKTYVRGRG